MVPSNPRVSPASVPAAGSSDATERTRAELLALRRDRNILLGERAQLLEELRYQRERIERLAHEVGRAEALASVTTHGPLARLAGWLRRAGAAAPNPSTHSGVSAHAGRSTPLAAQGDAIVPFVRLGRAPRVLIAVMTGLEPALLERTLAAVGTSSDHSEGAIESLCLTDCSRFELFRKHNLLFEYLPPVEQRARFASDLDWDLYILRRLARLRRKWNPARIVAFGQVARAQIQAWRASPFEDESIMDLISAPDTTNGLRGDGHGTAAH